MKMRRVVLMAIVVGVTGVGTAAAGKPPATISCGTDFWVNTQVSGTAGAPDGANTIVGDTSAFYLHDNNTVTARFQVNNCSHDYTMFLGPTRRLKVLLGGGRVMDGTGYNIDRVASVPLTEPAPPPDAEPGTNLLADWCATPRTRDADGRIVRDARLGFLDNYGGCGVDAEGKWYVRRAARILMKEGSSRTDYSLYFQASPQDGGASYDTCTHGISEVCAASFVRVYHPSANMWILRMEEAGPNGETLNGAAFTARGFLSYEWTPFQITVTPQ